MHLAHRLAPVALLASTLVAAGAAAAAPAGAPSVQKAPLAESGEFVPGELIVTFRPGVTSRAANRAHAELPGRAVARLGAEADVVRLPVGLSVRAGAARYEADPRVASAEPNYLRYRTEAIPPPNDEFFSELWGLHNTGQSHALSDAASANLAGTGDADMDVLEAWDTTQGSANTIVAVIDDGVDVAHPDLVGQLWTNPGESGGGKETNGIDDDGNGRVDDVNGWDFAHNNNTLLAPEGLIGGNSHGTHVAGTIAAKMGNSGGVAGVCPNCRIMVLKVMRDDNGAISDAAIRAALVYAKSKGAHVVNMSLGGPGWSNALREAIRKCACLAVVAAANNSLDNDLLLRASGSRFSPSYPASYTLPNILAVAASNHNDEYAYHTACVAVGGNTRSQCAFTNWGHDAVDVAAPGADIASTVTADVTQPPDRLLAPGYAVFNGTSMAAPNAAGVAALVKSQTPGLTPVQVKSAIMNSVDKPPSLGTMLSRIFSGPVGPGAFTRSSGRVNAMKALTASTANATPLTDGNIDGAKAMRRASVSGGVRWPHDVNDVFKKTLAKGRYRATLTGPAGRDFDLIVYKRGAKEIWVIRDILRASQSSTANEKVTFRIRAKGVYHFHIASYFSAGRYTLSLKKL